MNAALISRLRIGGAVTTFFGLKFAFGFVLIGVSTAALSVAGFVAFSQLFLLFALLSLASAAGVQNGLVRQIAKAKGNTEEESRAAAAALRIWLTATAIVIAAAVLLRFQASELLVGNTSLANTVPIVTVAASAGGFGTLACAIFNGRHRAPTSLLLQSAGLLVGGGLCIWRLLAGDATGAVLGYSAGPVATSMLALVALRGDRLHFLRRPAGLTGEVRLLLGYSLAFLAITIIMPSTLFALRHFYRQEFGTDLLGYWLAANRVSDVTSQILGLYMAQIFLPQATHEQDPARARALLLRTLTLGSAVMLGGWAVFRIAAAFFVGTFLSAKFLPAIPFISGYLLGDGLRVASSLTIHLMLARGRLASTVVVEGGTAMLLTVYIVALTAFHYPEGPYWAYPAAYATMALILLPALLRRRGSVP